MEKLCALKVLALRGAPGALKDLEPRLLCDSLSMLDDQVLLRAGGDGLSVDVGELAGVSIGP